MLSVLLALALAQGPVIRTQEPLAASPWVLSVRASCGSRVLTVSGYGAARPREPAPQLLVGRRPVTGPAVGQLLEDLSHPAAVYRLQILCYRSGGINLRISEGETQQGGAVRYRTASATIRGNQLVSYTGLQEAEARSFWFR
jgi:hypothetical protein